MNNYCILGTIRDFSPNVCEAISPITCSAILGLMRTRLIKAFDLEGIGNINIPCRKYNSCSSHMRD